MTDLSYSYVAECLSNFVCVYVLNEIKNIGIIRAVRDYYGGIKGCRCWLSQETTHIHSTVEDLGWGCGYRNIQMMISCLLMHPLYSDHVMSSKITYVCNYLFHTVIHTVVFCGIPTILELQKAIEKAWKEGIFSWTTN